MPEKYISEAYIAQRLAEDYKPQSSSKLWDFFPDEPRPAAVLIPLFKSLDIDNSNEVWKVLLTRRTDTVAEHQGQVAFPGGRAEATDTTPEMTALREAREEIGLDPLRVRILGRMNSLHTITNYMVSPIVGVIPWPFEVIMESTEVSRVFHIPLDWLADPSHHEVTNRTFPEQLTHLLQGKNHPVIYFQPFEGEVLWGVSAEIILSLVEILYNKKLAGN